MYRGFKVASVYAPELAYVMNLLKASKRYSVALLEAKIKTTVWPSIKIQDFVSAPLLL